MAVSPAMAQLPKFELEPYVGAYLPLKDLISEDIEPVGRVTGSQKEGFALGGRLTFWALGPIGFEGNFVYAWSDTELSAADTSETTSGHVWAGDVRAVWRILPGPIGIHVDGGVAYVGRGGDSYEDVTEGKSDVGGVIGAGLRIKLPGLFAIRADADAYLYEAQFTAEGEAEPSEKQFQADIIISAGLVIGLGL
ncbi:MAG: hypothetical protein AMS21_04025 [Gemmatimonas sp. SG8_38_2]|nr:MAG: hypothetical protein AMS21_04025 [Gemmatimonas sp. SG8_38_2]